MTTENTKILVVDDDTDYTDLISDMLGGEYTLFITSSGTDAIQIFKDKKPDLILLDINMPGMDGYCVCKTIKELDPGDNVAIIFVSGVNTIEERIESYDAGGDDYISKPFKVSEFKKKISATARFQESKKALVSKEEHARSVAFESMKEASQYGQVLQFLTASFSSSNTSTLSNEVFKFLAQLDLNSCLQIRTPTETLSLRPHSGQCSPIEIELFDVLKKRGRLYTFSHRMMINDAHVSILIKNMPIDNELEMGRLRDVLAVIIEGFEARVMDLERKEAITNIIQGLTSTISIVRSQFKEHQRQNVTIMDNLVFEMGSSLHILDLTEQQETFFMTLIQKSMVELVNVCDSGKGIEAEIDKITNTIKPFLE